MPRTKMKSKRRRGSGSENPDTENEDIEINPAHLGCVFTGAIQQTKFESFSQRNYLVQKFAHKQSLKELFIYQQIKTLFKNIGWGKLLGKAGYGYKRFTCEFLSSVYIDHGILNFRNNNRNCALSVDEICGMINAPTENTFGPDDQIDGYIDMHFWSQITREPQYIASRAKASSIIHPVLKVAHRIIASILYPRQETSTINSNELKLLYCMTHRRAAKPHFGRWLCPKLISLSHSSTGSLLCGGVVTLLARLAGVRYPEGVETIGEEIYLKVSNFQVYHIIEEDGRHKTWTYGTKKTPTLRVGRNNEQLLSLNRPTSTTDWLLTEVLEPQEEAQEDSSDDEDYNPQEEQQGQQQTGGTSGATPAYNPQEVPPYHSVYMTHFGLLHQNYTHLNDRVGNIESSVTSLNTNVSGLRNDVQQYRRSTEENYTNLWGLMTDMHYWTINQPGFQHPPPGYNPYPYPPPPPPSDQ